MTMSPIELTCTAKKVKVKNGWKLVPFRGGDRRLLANTIKNVHIVFVNPSPLKC